VGDKSHVVFGKKFTGEQGSAMQQLVLFSLKFNVMSAHIFMNVTVVCRIDWLACKEETFVKNALDVTSLIFPSSASFKFSIGRIVGLLLCLRVIPVNPGPVTNDNP
jgi:hypothetical protein